jgi:hypothetical protein
VRPLELDRMLEPRPDARTSTGCSNLELDRSVPLELELDLMLELVVSIGLGRRRGRG